jgi:hypothetical protein
MKRRCGSSIESSAGARDDEGPPRLAHSRAASIIAAPTTAGIEYTAIIDAAVPAPVAPNAAKSRAMTYIVVRHPYDSSDEQHPRCPALATPRREPRDGDERHRHRQHLCAHAEHGVDQQLVELRFVPTQLRVRGADHELLRSVREEDGAVAKSADCSCLERDRNDHRRDDVQRTVNEKEREPEAGNALPADTRVERRCNHCSLLAKLLVASIGGWRATDFQSSPRSPTAELCSAAASPAYGHHCRPCIPDR